MYNIYTNILDYWLIAQKRKYNVRVKECVYQDLITEYIIKTHIYCTKTGNDSVTSDFRRHFGQLNRLYVIAELDGSGRHYQRYVVAVSLSVLLVQQDFADRDDLTAVV